jgi:lipid II:glycine glycyltransferase (peptidoglycan interpeptide bridge formation enzyme)
MIGRANRLLHWEDILYFKQEGLSYYDFGGWSSDTTNLERQKINAFKESFGGVIIPQYSYYVPVSLLGKIFLAARKGKEILKR